MYLIGPEPYFDVSKRQLKKEVQDWEAKEMPSLWRKVIRQTEANKFINCLPKKKIGQS